MNKNISAYPDQLPVEPPEPHREHGSSLRTPIKAGFFLGQAIILLTLPVEIVAAILKLPSFTEAQANEGLIVSLCAYVPFVILCEVVAWVAFAKKQTLLMMVGTVAPLVALAGLVYLAMYTA